MCGIFVYTTTHSYRFALRALPLAWWMQSACAWVSSDHVAARTPSASPPSAAYLPMLALTHHHYPPTPLYTTPTHHFPFFPLFSISLQLALLPS